MDPLCAASVNLLYPTKGLYAVSTAMKQAGILSKLVMLLEVSTVPIRRTALSALVNLCLTSLETRRAVATAPGLIDQLVRCLEHPDSKLKLAAGKLFRALVVYQQSVVVDVTNSLTQAGVMNALATNFTAANTDFVHLLTRVLSSIITRVPIARRVLYDDGFIEKIAEIRLSFRNFFGVLKSAHCEIDAMLEKISFRLSKMQQPKCPPMDFWDSSDVDSAQEDFPLPSPTSPSRSPQMSTSPLWMASTSPSKLTPSPCDENNDSIFSFQTTAFTFHDDACAQPQLQNNVEITTM